MSATGLLIAKPGALTSAMSGAGQNGRPKSFTGARSAGTAQNARKNQGRETVRAAGRGCFVVKQMLIEEGIKKVKL